MIGKVELKRGRLNKWRLIAIVLSLALTPFGPFLSNADGNYGMASGIQGLPAMQPLAPVSGRDWDLRCIRANEAWQITTGNPRILVAVLDTGIDREHEALKGKIVASVNFSHSATVDDINGHGTHIAGLIAGKSGEGSGVTGLAYDCSLLNVKVAEDDGYCTAESVAEGIYWAADNGASVINISLALAAGASRLKEAVDYAWGKNCIIVAAAGNGFGSSPTYPAAYDKVIAVSAVNIDGEVPYWAKYGVWVDALAPGVDIYSTAPANSYASASGTSQAAALVSGEAALLFSIAGDADCDGGLNCEIRNAIIKSASRQKQVNCDSKNCIDIYRAIEDLDLTVK